MLHRCGPDHILQSTTSRVHIESVVIQDLRGEQIVVSLLDVLVLCFLKRISLIGSDAFPTGSERCGPGAEVLEIRQPDEADLRDETRYRAGLSGHLIRAVGDTARITDAGRD